MLDEQRGDNLFDGEFVIVRQVVNLFPILQKLLVEHLRLAFGFVEHEFVSGVKLFQTVNQKGVKAITPFGFADCPKPYREIAE
jgi:hypothetical protein